jgi:hypothetical protein
MSDERKSSGPGLAATYRRFTRQRPGQPAPDVDALLALADGEQSVEAERTLDDVARSGMHADLLRFARALAPESARLGVKLEQAFEATPAQHRRALPRRADHHGGARRWVRVAASLAACVLAAVAVWSLQKRGAPDPYVPVAATAAVRPDRIFAAYDAPVANKGDVIFRAEFRSDKIFRGAFSKG